MMRSRHGFWQGVFRVSVISGWLGCGFGSADDALAKKMTGAPRDQPVQASPAAPVSGPLHVASPDWRDQVIYFLMTDRFADGDPSNNNQGRGEFDPGRPSHFSGGDLAGIRQQLDYIQGLGATAVWITPPVRNQWWAPGVAYSGYHGYWASHFKQVDPHWGSMADLQNLSRALHGRGMYLVQDIVVNHVGDYFHYGKEWNPEHPERGLHFNVGSAPSEAPEQAPLDMNDPRKAKDRAAAIYHFTPDINDYENPDQVNRYQLSGLDDLNTENPVVKRLLRDSYAYWIREAGVDAFRVDTAFYVKPEFFEDFLFSQDAQAPGILAVAQETGRRNFLTFGEGFAIDRPGQEVMSRKIETYVKGEQGQQRLHSMINFPLYGSLGDVFARGQPTQVLADRISSMMRIHQKPHWMPSFIDNHDVDRFLQGGTESGMRLALGALFTLPGIPTIYYGTEQGFRSSRASMFAGGWGSQGQDHFTADAALYQDLKALASLRKTHKVLSRGVPRIIRAQASGPGVLAWMMEGGDEASKERALVVFNTSEEPVAADELALNLPAGGRWASAFAMFGQSGAAKGGEPLQVDRQGRVNLLLPGQSMQVWLLPAERSLQGAAPAATPVVDVIVKQQWQPLAAVQDPQGDDQGPMSRYQYPLDPTWGKNRQADVLGLRAFRSGQDLRLEIPMHQLTRSWNPQWGFDHVALSLFLAWPNEGGAVDIPFQNAKMPEGLRWQLRGRLHGWSNAWFGSEGAGPDADGQPLGRSARVHADVEKNTIELEIPAALTNGRSLEGLAIYVLTWDYDRGFRALKPQSGPYSFGGGDGAVDPLWMDSVLLKISSLKSTE